jgi:hypothetical protein
MISLSGLENLRELVILHSFNHHGCRGVDGAHMVQDEGVSKAIRLVSKS